MDFRGLKFDRSFTEEVGQDLSEYCLLLALVILVAVGIFVKVSGGAQSLWTSANSTLTSTPASAPASGSGAAVH
jgi:Flp pilus assembly pilin Flp